MSSTTVSTSTDSLSSPASRSTIKTHDSHVGVLDSVRWSSPSDDYIIANLQDGSSIKGPAQRAELQRNQCYRFLGRWEPAKGKYGPTFVFVAFFQEVQLSRSGVVDYLCRMLKDHKTGIGRKTANRIYDEYEGEAVKRIMLFPKEIAEEFGLDIDGVRTAARILNADKKMQDTKIALVELFSGYSFPKDTITECIKLWGVKAPAIVRRNPFQLLLKGIKGAGFLRCDKLFLANGGKPNLLIRQTLAAWYSLRSEGTGDTWYPLSQPFEMCKKLLAGVTPDPVRAMKIGGKKRFFGFYLDATTSTENPEALVRGPTTEKSSPPWSIWVSEYEAAKSETDIARIVKRIVPKSLAWSAWPTLDMTGLTDHQKTELSKALKSRIAILTGTPGTGKTYTAAVVVRAILKTAKEGDIAIMAPTGKAAVRVAEALERYDISLPANTIHRTLRPNDLGFGTGNWNFGHNEKDPLPAKWIIVDESSMIDADLMAAIFRALHPDAHILLVGDPYQLPPVGHGAPFRDLIDSGIVSVGELRELHRNSGMIAEVCQRIKDGNRFATASKFDPATGQNLLHMPATDIASSIARIDEIIKAIEAGKIAHSSGRPIDLVEEFQVLVAMNDRGVSRKVVNEYLQNRLNKDGEQKGTNPFRVGDKIICTSNGSYVDAKQANLRHQIMNGEMGRIVELPSEKMIVMYFAPVGSTELPRVVMTPAVGEGCTFQHAYAITTHKSQGSEWPVVAVVVDPSANRICSREWHYTAISRAKVCGVMIGSLSVLHRQCERVTLKDRKTFLRERLVSK